MHQAFMGLKKAIKITGIAITSSVILTLGNNQAWAGQATVVTTGDSSAGGTVNFNADPGSAVGVTVQTLETAGGAIPVTIAQGIIAQVSSQATAINQGLITQAQADQGIGSGGAVVDLSAYPQVIASVVSTSTSETIALPGSGQVSFATAIASLADSPTLANVSVTTPSGATVTIAQVLANVSNALSTNSPVLIPTALNDASIALVTVLGNVSSLPPGSRDEVQRAARTIAALLAAVQL